MSRGRFRAGRGPAGEPNVTNDAGERQGAGTGVRAGTGALSGEGEAPVEPSENSLDRRRPASGLYVFTNEPTIVFLTVCTRDRKAWVANEKVDRLITSAWKLADAWVVGRYVLMPDHIHLFCAPGERPLPLERWVRFWKSCYSRLDRDRAHRWQGHHWDTRLRRRESYDEKWEYVRLNPVHAGLVARAEDWPHQGELNALAWW